MFGIKKKQTIKEFDEEYGHTRLDRVLSYMVYGIVNACIIVVGIAGLYAILNHLINFISNWIYWSFIR